MERTLFLFIGDLRHPRPGPIMFQMFVYLDINYYLNVLGPDPINSEFKN